MAKNNKNNKSKKSKKDPTKKWRRSNDTMPKRAGTHIYRKGLNLQACDVFRDKFKEFYIQYYNKYSRKHIDTLNNNDAHFMINKVCEAIIRIIDNGWDLWLDSFIYVKSYLYNCAPNRAKQAHPERHIDYVENVRRVAFKPVDSWVRKIKINLNKDNQEFQQFLEDKKVRYNKILDYYKEFYNQPQWWTGELSDDRKQQQ